MLLRIGDNLFLTLRYRAYSVADEADGIQRYRFPWKTVDMLANEVIRLWMQSPAHRYNPISPACLAAAARITNTAHETIFGRSISRHCLWKSSSHLSNDCTAPH